MFSMDTSPQHHFSCCPCVALGCKPQTHGVATSACSLVYTYIILQFHIYYKKRSLYSFSFHARKLMRVSALLFLQRFSLKCLQFVAA